MWYIVMAHGWTGVLAPHSHGWTRGVVSPCVVRTDTSTHRPPPIRPGIYIVMAYAPDTSMHRPPPIRPGVGHHPKKRARACVGVRVHTFRTSPGLALSSSLNSSRTLASEALCRSDDEYIADDAPLDHWKWGHNFKGP